MSSSTTIAEPIAMPPGPPAPSAPDALTFLRALWRLNHLLERQSRRMARELGVTFPQRTVVRLVGKSPGISPGELAEFLHIDPGTLSTILRGLEKRGLIVRGSDPEDRRRGQIRLTQAGEALETPAPLTVEAIVTRVLTEEGTVSYVDAMAFLNAVSDRLAEAGLPRRRRGRA
ncbi:MAG: MarR family transcriptional regulator [Cytophagaceae bacterium]|nr:MarR family transcriptional regulator [Gemmatimonadaceae bacterium]